MNPNSDMDIRPNTRQPRGFGLTALSIVFCALAFASPAAAVPLDEATGEATGAVEASAAATAAAVPSAAPVPAPTVPAPTVAPAPAPPTPATSVPTPATSVPSTPTSAPPTKAVPSPAGSILRSATGAASNLPSIAKSAETTSITKTAETAMDSVNATVHSANATTRRVASQVTGSIGGLPRVGDSEGAGAEVGRTLDGVLAATTSTVRGIGAAALEGGGTPLDLLPSPSPSKALGPSPSAPTPVGLGASDFTAALEVSPRHGWFPGALVRQAVTDMGGMAPAPAGRGAHGPVAFSFARFLSTFVTEAQASATVAAFSSSPAHPSLPPSPLPGPAPAGTAVGGGGISLFFPLVALLALFALAAPAISRRLREAAGSLPPVPFICALERPG